MQRNTATLTVLVLLAASCATLAAKPAVTGKWAITGKLVTTSATDPNAPKPGTVLHDTWVISKTNEAYSLKTSKGTVPGKATSSGVVFSTTFPFVAGVHITVTIECVAKSDKVMYGTEEIVYTGTNCVTGAPIPLGREAWTFSGKKK